MIANSDEHPPGRLRVLLGELTALVSRNAWPTLGVVALLCIASLGITFRFLGFKTNRSDLIAPDAAFHQRWLNYIDKFGEQSDIIVVVESEQSDRLKAALDAVGARLQQETQYFSRVVYRIDPSSLRRKALQFLTPDELERLNNELAMYGPVLDGHWDRAGLEAYSGRLSSVLQAANAGMLPPNADPAATVSTTLEHSRRLATSLNGFMASGGQNFESPWPVMFDQRGMSTSQTDPFGIRYQLSDHGTMGFVLATPVSVESNFSGSSGAIQEVRSVIAQARIDFPDVTIGMTGIPVLESDEMQRSQQDMTMASLISFAGVGIILLVGFRGFRHPLLAMVMLAVGISWSMGYITMAVGHLNILSVSFAAILIGLGIDFAVIYLARYIELRHQGYSLTDSLVNSSNSVGTGIVTAAVTTSLAFFCATFTNFLGVAELGVIAGGGVALCALSTLVVLPALVTVADRRMEPRQLPTPFQGKLLRRITQFYPGTVCLLSVLIIGLIGMQAMEFKEGRLWSKVQYDSNLLNLQAEGVESVELQQKVFHELDGSLLYAVSIAESAAEARRLHDEFLALPTVKRVDDLGSLMPRYPAAETGLLIQAAHSRLSRISELPREVPQLDPLAIGQAVEKLYISLKDRPEPDAREAATAFNNYLNALETQELPQQMKLLAGYQYAMLAALHGQFQALASMSNPEPITPLDFPGEVRSQFVSDQGDWLVRVFPSTEIWDEEPLAKFVTDVRTVDPEVTGTPLQNYEASRQIRESYLNAAVYALAIIWIVLLIDSLEIGPMMVSLLAPLAVVAFAIATIHGPQKSIDPTLMIMIYVAVAVMAASIFDFVSVRNTVFSLLPPLAGALMMFGILSVLGVDLNPANLIVLPLILGIGVDYGVHVVHDFRMQHGPYQTTPSTINAVTITSLTSMMGFGSMLVSAHQGLRSLAIVLLVGVGSCLFVSLVLLPAALTLVARSRTDEPDTPPRGSDGSELLRQDRNPAKKLRPQDVKYMPN